MNITVTAESPGSTVGKLTIGEHVFKCTLGECGLINETEKIEGDKKTPLGEYRLIHMFYRADRNPQPQTKLDIKELTPQTGWCEDPAHPDYNKEVTLPHPSMCDKMTRDDHLYDYVIVINHNKSPTIPGKGSAIFIHLARPEFTPTAGCVGLKEKDMLEVLKLCDSDSKITIKIK